MERKDLKNKAIKFKWKDYVEVKERILYLADEFGWDYSIETDYQYYPEVKTWVVKAKLTLAWCVYNWLAQEIEWTSFINNTSALENAETSAVWRACAMAWIWVIDSIASVDEINKATNRSKQKEKPWFNQKELDWMMKKKDTIKTYSNAIDIINKHYRISNEMKEKVRELFIDQEKLDKDLKKAQEQLWKVQGTMK